MNIKSHEKRLQLLVEWGYQTVESQTCSVYHNNHQLKENQNKPPPPHPQTSPRDTKIPLKIPLLLPPTNAARRRERDDVPPHPAHPPSSPGGSIAQQATNTSISPSSPKTRLLFTSIVSFPPDLRKS